MLVEVYAAWSLPSVELHDRLRASPAAGASERFVRLIVDVTNGDDAPIAQRYGLASAPILLVVAPDGTVRRRTDALPSADELAAMLAE